MTEEEKEQVCLRDRVNESSKSCWQTRFKSQTRLEEEEEEQDTFVCVFSFNALCVEVVERRIVVKEEKRKKNSVYSFDRLTRRGEEDTERRKEKPIGHLMYL
jgi:hypothetical protein